MTLLTRPTRRTAPCPVCTRRSRRVPSQYQRTLAKLPLAGRPVVLRVQVRRFRCANPTCPRAIFAERLPRLGPVRARRTPDQQRALEQIGFALGGAAGARLADRLDLPASQRVSESGDAAAAAARRAPLSPRSHPALTPRHPASSGSLIGPGGAASGTAHCSLIWSSTSRSICCLTGPPRAWRPGSARIRAWR